MNKRSRQTAVAIISAVLLIGALIAIWIGSKYFLGLLTAANPEVAAAIIGAMSTALVGIAAAVLTHRAARRRSIDEAHRTKKVAIYHEFLEVIARLMANQNESINLKPLKNKELINFLVKFKSDIMLWGSPNVINAFQVFTSKAEAKGTESLKAVDDFYRAIRDDIGLSNRGLESYALVKMYLSDPSELDTAITANRALKSDAKKTGAA